MWTLWHMIFVFLFNFWNVLWQNTWSNYKSWLRVSSTTLLETAFTYWGTQMNDTGENLKVILIHQLKTVRSTFQMDIANSKYCWTHILFIKFIHVKSILIRVSEFLIIKNKSFKTKKVYLRGYNYKIVVVLIFSISMLLKGASPFLYW